MIPRSSKFPLRTEFVALQRKSAQQATPHLRLLASPHSPTRLAVIVPLKVSKRATVRASLRRLVYDTYWPTIKDRNLDCVVIFKPIAAVGLAALAPIIIAELKDLYV